MDAYRGLAQRSPVLAFSMLLFLLSLGGIPFVAGFWAKLFIFRAVVDRALWLALLGAVLTIVALSTTSSWPGGCTSTRPSARRPSSVRPLLELGIGGCVVGVVVWVFIRSRW